MTAEEILNSYFTLKDSNDTREQLLSGKPSAPMSYDEMLKKELDRRNEIQAHGNDPEYARRLLEKELERSNRLSGQSGVQEIRKRQAAADKASLYEERIYAEHLREARRQEAQERYEETLRERYEEERRREEEYRRRRQADEEYYAQLRERNR